MVVHRLVAVEEIDYKDIFQKPAIRTVSFVIEVSTFAFVFSFLYEFSFFLFALNTFNILFEIYSMNVYDFNLVLSILLGGVVACITFSKYQKRIRQSCLKGDVGGGEDGGVGGRKVGVSKMRQHKRH
jgi:hypothetical protein